jgi:ABC-type multidrug transport system fused ATPase/permease subunit
MRSWFRFASTVSKGGGAPPPPPPKGALWRMLRTAGPEKWLIGLSFITLGVSTLTSLSLPYTVGKLVDASTGYCVFFPILFFSFDFCSFFAGDEEKKAKVGYTPTQICGGMLVLFTFSAAATFGTTALLRVAGERLVRRTREQLFGALLRQPVVFVESKTGELVSRMSTDTQQMSNAISENMSVGTRKVLFKRKKETNSLLKVAVKVLEGVGTMGVLMYLNPVLTGTMVCVMPIFFGSGYFGRWVKKQTEVQVCMLFFVLF